MDRWAGFGLSLGTSSTSAWRWKKNGGRDKPGHLDAKRFKDWIRL
jgi:hypothetical protein